jgi:glycosyltransferase involved in cell wall biosynthesis
MADKNLVSIVVPMFNSEKTIKVCLTSVAEQTHEDWECIIVNDGSVDSSREIAESFATLDNRFHVLTTENKGVSDARNLGITHSRGSYVAFLDSDDYWSPAKLEKQLRLLEAFPNFDAVLCNFYIGSIGRKGELSIRRKVDFPMTPKSNELWLNFEGNGPLLTSTLLIRRNSLFHQGIPLRFNSNLSTTADVDFFLRFSSFGSTLSIKEYLVTYLTSSNQMHLNAELLLTDYPKMLEGFSQLGIIFSKERCLGNLHIMASLLYLRKKSIRKALFHFVTSFNFSRKSWLILPLRIFLKKMSSRIIKPEVIRD